MSRYILPPSTVNDLIRSACTQFRSPQDFLVLIYIGNESSFLSEINTNENDYEIPSVTTTSSSSCSNTTTTATAIPAKALRSLSGSSEPALPTIFDKVFPIFLKSADDLGNLILSYQLDDYIHDRLRKLDSNLINQKAKAGEKPGVFYIALWGLIDSLKGESPPRLTAQYLNNLLCQVMGKSIGQIKINFTLADKSDIAGMMIPLLPLSHKRDDDIVKEVSISHVLRRWLKLTKME